MVLVSSNIPIIRRSIPPMNEIIGKILLISFTSVIACPTKTATKRKGTANPVANTKSNNIPSFAPWEVAARVRMEPNTGPTHGVHPSAKKTPKRNELKGLPGVSLFINDNFF